MTEAGSQQIILNIALAKIVSREEPAIERVELVFKKNIVS
jgi:hypothetical protein